MTGLYVKLDAEYASDDKLIEAGPLAELLYVRGLCFAKRTMLDGKITRSQLAAVAIGIPTPAKQAQRLVDVGAWTITKHGWQITAWLKRNKSATTIGAESEAKRVASQMANHERWHVKEGKPSLTCPLCDPLWESKFVRTGSTSASTEPKAETQTEEEEEASGGRVGGNSTSPTPGTDAAAAAAAIDGLVDQALGAALELRRDASHVRNPLTWEPATRAALRRDHEAAVRVLLTDKGCTPERAARVVLGLEQLPPEAVKQAWYADPFCECGGDGWQTLQDNTFGPCDCRRSDPYELATVHQLHEEKTA